MEARSQRQSLKSPLAIYEVHLGSWRRGEGNRLLSYRELAEQLVDYVCEMGFTHIELLPVMEHPLDESWGYQTVGYFAPTSRHGTPAGLHVFCRLLPPARDRRDPGLGAGALSRPMPMAWRTSTARTFTSTTDPRLREHPDWGTRIFNYGRSEVRNFL